MDYIINFAAQYAAFTFPASIVAPLIGGETAVLGLSFLAGQGALPLWAIIPGSFLGMVLLDSFWFFFPRTRWGVKVKQKSRDNFVQYRKLEERIQTLSHKNDVIILLISKILLGTRILILIYLSMREITFWKFLRFNSIATGIWAIALGYIGWFAGLGYYSLAQATDDITIAGFYIAGAIALFYLMLLSIRKWVTKE